MIRSQKDCTSALTDLVGTDVLQVYEETGSGSEQPIDSFESLFQNTETVDCPITECTYSDAG
jgi:hypothetical protein